MPHEIDPLEELLILVERCRYYQREYFAHRGPSDLRSARDYERRVDKLVEKINRSRIAPGLFDVKREPDPPDKRTARRLPTPEDDRRVAAIRWIEANPAAMAAIEKTALDLARSQGRFGVKLLIERARWMYSEIHKTDGFKINNNHAPYVARWLVARHESLRAAIELRRTGS